MRVIDPEVLTYQGILLFERKLGYPGYVELLERCEDFSPLEHIFYLKTLVGTDVIPEATIKCMLKDISDERLRFEGI